MSDAKDLSTLSDDALVYLTMSHKKQINIHQNHVTHHTRELERNQRKFIEYAAECENRGVKRDATDAV